MDSFSRVARWLLLALVAVASFPASADGTLDKWYIDQGVVNAGRGGTCAQANHFEGPNPATVASAVLQHTESCVTNTVYRPGLCENYTATTPSVTCAFQFFARDTGVQLGSSVLTVMHAFPSGPAAAYCAAAAGGYGGPRAISVSSLSGQMGTTKTYCATNLGPLSDGSTASCRVSGTVTAVGGSGSGSGGYAWMETTTYTGGLCDGTEASAGGEVASGPDGSNCTDPASCKPPPGKCPGTVNGLPVWVSCDFSSSQPMPQTVTTSTNGSGTVTTTVQKQSTCDAASCTVTTTTNSTPSGGSTTTSVSTTTVSKTVYCSGEGKTDPVCGKGGSGVGDGGEGSAFGGSCSAGFTCSGDAATCAIAKASWEERCIVDSLKTNLADSKLTAAVQASALNGANPSDHPGENASVVDLSGYVDKSNPFSSSCPADYVINAGIAGSIAVPFSSACGVLQMMGNLLVGLTLLVCALWLVKGS